MTISRRRFLQMLSASGVTLSASSWLAPRLEAYANERLDFADVRGPGISSFSRSVCRDCANHCSLTLRKVDRIPVGIRGTAWHPSSEGALCLSGQSQMQALFDPNRLGHPVLRADAGAPGRVAEWEEGLEVLRESLRSVLTAGDGERLAVIDGRTPSLGTRLVEAWVRSIPGAKYVPLRIEAALDQLARGFLRGGPAGRLRLDLARTGTLLLVGHELLEGDGSPVTQMRAHGDRREDPRLDHAPTIYLGPRQSPTAVKSDYWIPCLPGQERDILLGFAEALSRDHPNKRAVLEEYAGWILEARDPVAFARQYALESVARRHGLKMDELETAVRAMKEFGPAVTLPGPGILRRSNGFAAAGAAFALNAWTGGFREEGGLSWGSDPLSDVAETLGLPPARDHDPGTLADMLQPLFEIKRSPVDVAMCVHANPVQEFPGRDQIARALSHIPFLAAFSSHEDETSRLAHVTIPTLLELESWDLPAAGWGVPEPAVQVQRQALVPVVDARSVEDVILDLASSGLAGPGFSAPARDSRGLVEAALVSISRSARGELVGEDGRRPLASVASADATKMLLSGESVWVPEPSSGPRAPAHGAQGAPPRPMPDLAPEQMWLVPFDSPAIQRGRNLNRPMMMELSGALHGLGWESWVEIHPIDARARGISSGDSVRLRGPRAEIPCRAIVTRSVTPSVLAAPVGFGHEALGQVAAGTGSNPLELPYAVFDPNTGAPAWGPVPVFIVRA